MNPHSKSTKHHNQNVTTTFSVVERKIPCTHKFQLYVDYGHTHVGPWLKIGLNDSEFGVGYLPVPKPRMVAVS